MPPGANLALDEGPAFISSTSPPDYPSTERSCLPEL